MTEAFISFGNSFVASTSDFWHHPYWKMAFGASVANVMTNGYKFNDGLFVAVSNTTLKSVDTKILRSKKPYLHRCQALLDFCSWLQPKTGELIGSWLEECHKAVGCKPDYIGSHIVDGAANAGKSVEWLEWNTESNRSQKIIADGCDAHKINTTAGIASGRSQHTTNLNPKLGSALSLLHEWLGKFVNYKAYQDTLEVVRKEHGRVRTPRVSSSVVTRWNSSFDETQSANANQLDINLAIQRILAPGGAGERIRTTETDSNIGAEIQDSDWELYAQYEGALLPVKRYSMASQSAQVIAHEELFWAMSTIEALRAPFFVMYENVSKSTHAKNLMVRRDTFDQKPGIFILLYGPIHVCFCCAGTRNEPSCVI